jgi:tRNA-uridine 2-sulfurtransferase
MRIHPYSRDGRQCSEPHTTTQEAALKELASSLGIPLTVVDMREAFERLVIRPFLLAYLRGLTPNPCITCNPELKFGLLLQAAQHQGAVRLATGHYARLLPPDFPEDRFRLFRAHDHKKDQSYFLYRLTQEQLASAAFPLGNLEKSDVLRWAGEAGLSSLIPEESQEICFIPSGNYHEFLRRMPDLSPLPPTGRIVDMEGNVLGEHRGIFAYTVGQRRGMGIASSAPYYVVDLDASTNTVRVGRANHLFRQELDAKNVNWVSIPPPSGPLRCQVRIRNQHIPAPALVTRVGEAQATVRFDEPQRAVTPGQAAVFYDGDLLLGGGTIRKMSDE